MRLVGEESKPRGTPSFRGRISDSGPHGVGPVLSGLPFFGASDVLSNDRNLVAAGAGIYLTSSTGIRGCPMTAKFRKNAYALP